MSAIEVFGVMAAHIAHLLQNFHNSSICDVSGETFECFEVL